ncbi:MAG: MFS transporter [Actinobacteria bacterium]|nr:MAG: MFS transporter [Actinomycetota bacterium]REK38007.1 MAG: MFS transporter [Actinomycetota bacterium]
MSYVRSVTSLGPRYIALWVGQAVSQFGTYVAFLSLPLLVDYINKLADDESILDLSITYALETVPTLLVGLVGGVLLDRWHLRPVMIATDLIRACGFFYLAATIGDYGVGTVFVVAFLVGSMTTLFDGALFALIPSLVPERRLADANGYIAASQQANFALGPLAAGVMAFSTGTPAVGLWVNGMTFLVSALSLYWVGRVAHHRSAADARNTFFREAANGIKYIMAEPRLRITTIASAIPNFVVGFIEATFVVLAPVVFNTQNEVQIGVLLAAFGVGGVIGALLAPSVIRRIGLGATMTIGMGITGACLLAVMFTEYGVVTILLQIGWMVGVGLINVALATIRQHYATDAMLGRVITASRAIGWATLPLGALVGGWLGASEETYPLVARVFPVLIVATALWLLTTVVWRDTFGPREITLEAGAEV